MTTSSGNDSSSVRLPSAVRPIRPSLSEISTTRRGHGSSFVRLLSTHLLEIHATNCARWCGNSQRAPHTGLSIVCGACEVPCHTVCRRHVTLNRHLPPL